MDKIVSAITTAQALILGVVTLGCATAGLLTGHLDQGAWLGVAGGVGGIGGLVTTAHVVGSQVNAAASPPPAPATAGPVTTGTV